MVREGRTPRPTRGRPSRARWAGSGRLELASQLWTVTMAANGLFDVQAMVPGMVTDVLVQTGANVELGQELLLIESMKMEVALTAERGGQVVEVLVTIGEPVEGGQVLMRLRTDDESPRV